MSDNLKNIKCNGIFYFFIFIIAGCESSDNTDSPMGADIVIEKFKQYEKKSGIL